MARIVSVGEILWDVFPAAEHLGGAAFNFAVHAALLGHEVYFVSAVGDDERGRRALARARDLGLETRFIGVVRDAPTGHVSVSVDAAGVPSFVIHRPAAYDLARLEPHELDELVARAPAWIYYGTLYSMHDNARRLTATLLETLPAAQRFYDVNLRKDCYTPALVEELLARAGVVKLNDAEMQTLAEMFGLPSEIEAFARNLSARYHLEAVCVTQGAAGCSLLAGGEWVSAPGYRVTVADTVGSGDAFAAALLHGLTSGWPAPQVADFANRVGAMVASRAGGTPRWCVEEALALRAEG